MQFHAQFDHVILLSAPPGTLVERLAARTGNSYGAKHPKSCAASSMTSATSSPGCGRWPIMKSGQTMPLNEVVSAVLRLVSP